MKVSEFTFDSSTAHNKIFTRLYEPDGEPKAVLQISHGMAEHSALYKPFCEYMAQRGFVVVINDHLGHGRRSFAGADDATLDALLLAEYLHSWGRLDKHTGMDMDTLKACLHKLLEQCRQWQRPAAGEAAAAHKEHPINPDGALLVRFLAQKGLDEERA